MKKKHLRFLFLSISILTLSTAIGQTKSNGTKKTAANDSDFEVPLTPGEKANAKLTEELVQNYLEYIKGQTQKQNTGMSVADKSAKLIEYFNTNGLIQDKLAKLYDTKFSKPVTFKALPNEPAKFHLLAGIQEPIINLPVALATYTERTAEAYLGKIDKAEDEAKRAAQELAGETKVVQTYKKGGDEAVKKMYEEEVNASFKNNPVLAQMDVAALQKMSQKEREEYVRKMTAAQTGGATPEQIQKMTPDQKRAMAEQMMRNQSGQSAQSAFTQEMMTNKAFAKRFNEAGTEEKQKIYKEFEERYYGQAGKPASATASNQQKGASTQNIAQVRELQEFQNKTTQVIKKLEADLTVIGNRQSDYDRAIRLKAGTLTQWVKKSMDASPRVSRSEYGTEILYEGEIKHAAGAMFYELEQEKTVKETEIWYAKVKVHGEALRELENLAAAYSKTSSDDIKLQVASLRAGGFESIRQLLKEADRISNNAASAQYQFNCEILHDCKDPRQDKRRS
ncbi:hypothetical protein [Flavisolibacter tropicus]|uniref:Uncharacterized protein n=1 Tax=Flavisolibacter tropicus TaxID=1492898 RepID=A0A172U035_9BACT|nr:hypothetical protein [Flavisolibacter tropicus]ANE52592.1 hypothetical protein SY85_21015 [Flavisolibacter tropicus]